MREKRTGVDFSKHELIFTEEKGIMVHHLKKPGTIIYNVKFINTNDVLLVTGDVGNWVFCREFHPSDKGFVSGHYWLEKLSTRSEQVGVEFSSEDTIEEIEAGINGGLAEYGYDGDELEEAIEYYKELLTYSDSPWEYEGFAYSNIPSFMDAEEVPNCKKTKLRLQIVFDAFDEICKRMEMESVDIEFSTFYSSEIVEGKLIKNKSFDGGYEIKHGTQGTALSLVNYYKTKINVKK